MQLNTAKILVLILMALGCGATALAQTMIPHSGEIEDVMGFEVADGEYPMTFLVWSKSEGGELIWEESYDAVTVDNGSFNIRLGFEREINLLPSNLWLEVIVGEEAALKRVALSDQAHLTVLGPTATSELRLTPSGQQQNMIYIGDSGGELSVINFSGGIILLTQDGASSASASIYAHAEGSVQLPKGSDASFVEGSGYLVIGKEWGPSLVFDDNEIMARNNGSSSTLYLQQDGGDVFVNGSVVHTSDARRKVNVRGLDRGLEELRQLRPVTFAWPNRPTERRLGLIAQEVKPVVEEVVYEDEEGMLGISYQSLVPLLIQAIQEQQDQIDQLRFQLDATNQARAEP